MHSFRKRLGVLGFVWNHPANDRHQLRALAHAVRFQALGRLGLRTVTPIGSHYSMYAVLHYSASSKVAYANPPDWQEMNFWRAFLRPGDLFIDVGANVGTYALWAADCGAEVIAVEPDPAAAALARENIELNVAPIVLHQVALGAEDGSLVLTQGLDSMNHIVLGAGHIGGLHVPVMTLDVLLSGRRAAGVKIDVEGAERLVLEGGRSALSSGSVGVIQLEWNSLCNLVLGESRAPIISLLRETGYALYRPDDAGCLHPTDVVGYGRDVFAVAPGVSVPIKPDPSNRAR